MPLPTRRMPLQADVLKAAEFTSLQERMSRDLFTFGAQKRRDDDADSLGSLLAEVEAPDASDVTGATGYEGMLAAPELEMPEDTSEPVSPPTTQPARTTGLMQLPTLEMPEADPIQPRQPVYDPTVSGEIQGPPTYEPNADAGVPPGVPPTSRSVPPNVPPAIPGKFPEEQARVYQQARASGLDDEGARVLVAVSETEGGARGAVGDQGKARGVYQFHEGGEMPGFRAWLRRNGIEGDPNALAVDPETATRYAAEGYLGQAVKRGRELGYSGAELATYVQRTGQRSVRPETTGENYTRLFGNQAAAPTAPATVPPTQAAAESRAQSGETRVSRVDYPLQSTLSDPDKWAVCGPVAAMAMASANGTPIDYETAKAKAHAAGWRANQGMAGPASQVALLNSVGVASRMEAVNWEKVKADVRNGNPVVLSSPGSTGHYWVVQGVDDQGRLDLGNSALTVSGGRRWMTPQEMRALGAIGNVDTAIYMDNPAAPTPSHATRVSNMPPAHEQPMKIIAERDALALAAGAEPAGSPPPAPGSAPLPGAGSDPTMLRQSLGQPVPMPGTVDEQASGGVPGLGVPERGRTGFGSDPMTDQNLMYPVDQRRPGEQPYDSTTPEGTDTSNDPLMAPWVPVAPWPDQVAPGDLYRQPLGQQPELPPDAPPAPPVRDDWREPTPPVTSSYNDPTAGGTIAQPVPVIPGPDQSPSGAPIRSAAEMPAPVVQPAPAVPVAPQSTERYLDTSLPSPPGWQAIVDGAGQVVDWVQERTQDAAEGIKEAGTAVASVADEFVNGPQVGGPNDSLPPVEGFPGEPDYQSPVTRVQAAQQASATRRALPIGERLVADLAPVVNAVTGADEGQEQRQQAGAAFKESVRSAVDPVIRPVEGAVTAAEQAIGAPPGAFRQAAEDVSNVLPVGPAVGVVRRGAGMADDAGRAASQAGQALTEGARPIRASATAEAARLRLDKFPEEVRDLIQQSAGDAGWARTQRRGVLPDEVVQRMADEDTRTVDQIIKAGKAGTQYSAEETVAVRNAVASQATVVRELSQEIADARTAGMTPDLLLARRAAESVKLQGLVEIAEGARAEAGRTLRQYAQQARLIDLNPDDAIARIRKKIGDPDEFTKIVDEYTKAVQEGADPIQMAKLWAKVERGEITTGEVFALYRRFNMLSGPRTFEVNVLSGGLNLGYEVATDALGQVARGRVGEAAAEIAAPFKAGARAFQNLAETMWHGVTVEQAARGDIPRTLSSRTDNPAAKAALTVMEVPDRLNAGVDQFFRTLTEDWAVTRLAHRQAREAGLSPRSEQWTKTVADNLAAIREDVTKFPEITQMASRVTFSEEPGGVVKWLEQGKRNYPNLIGFVMPFIRTPANIASRAVDISPFGLPRNIIEAGFNVGRGREQIGSRVRDIMVGTAATVWAYTQAQQGNITGAGPDDPEKVAMLRATGWQPYSVKIGDQYWSYANFAPFSLALSTGAAAYEAQKYAKPDKGDTLSLLSDGAQRTAKVVTDMTVLAGIGAVVKSIQDPDRYGTQWLSTSLTQLMPAGSLVNTIGQATDPLLRRSERTDVGTQVSQNLQARVPGLRETVPPAQDPLGRPIPNPQTGAGALNPFRPTTERPDPVLQAFIDTGVDIGKPREKLALKQGASIEMTAEEQRRWNTLRGEAIIRMTPSVTASPDYRSATATIRQKALERVRDRAAEEASGKMLSALGEAEIRRRMRGTP